MTSPEPLTEIFNDGVLQATLLPGGLVHLKWLTNDRGRLSKQAVRDLRKIEEMIRSSADYVGWIYGSEHDHTEFHRLTQRAGGRMVGQDLKYTWFAKMIKGGD